MTNDPDATSGAAVRVHGRLAMIASRTLWSPRVTIVAQASGEWVLHSEKQGDESPPVLGWTEAELSCINVIDLVHPDDQETLYGIAEITMKRSRFVPLVLRISARDGRYWYTRWRLGDPGGALLRAHGLDYLHPAATPGPPIATWCWDPVADVVSWSSELYDMLALSVGAPSSLESFLATVHAEDRSLVASRLRAAVADGGPFAYTFRCPAGQGHHRWFHASGRCSTQDRGVVNGLVKYLNSPARSRGPAPIGYG